MTSTPLCEGGTAAKGRCYRVAVHTVEAGCVHEHIVTSMVCDEDLARLHAGKFACGACLLGEDSHECTLLGRAVVPS